MKCLHIKQCGLSMCNSIKEKFKNFRGILGVNKARDHLKNEREPKGPSLLIVNHLVKFLKLFLIYFSTSPLWLELILTAFLIGIALSVFFVSETVYTGFVGVFFSANCGCLFCATRLNLNNACYARFCIRLSSTKTCGKRSFSITVNCRFSQG